MPRTKNKLASADAAAMTLLVPEQDRAAFDRHVVAAVARNAALQVIDDTREEEHLSKKALADKAGLEASVVRRLLTSETANPTTENVFRLMSALGIHVVAKTPSGKEVALI
jgi:ribosome-binding protein aMBF1 (putative translation factor)